MPAKGPGGEISPPEGAPIATKVAQFAKKPSVGRIVRDKPIASRPMTTCVVTGGAGFLGSHLCEHLLGAGHRVICLDNLETGSLENIAHIRDERFDFRHIDITEYVDMPEPVDFVYHLASPASPIDYLRLPLHTLKVGSLGTHNMLGLAKWKRARFLIASTSEVYGDPKVHPQTEDYWGNVNPIGPRGVYDEAKRYAEALTMAYHRQQGVDTAIVRIFNTYGPRMRPHDGRAIPTFLRQALQDRPLTVFGDGSQTRSFCYVDDLIRGIVALSRVRRPHAGQHRQPGRVHAARTRQDGDRGDRLALADRLRGAAHRRSPAAPPRHRPRPRPARLGTDGQARRGPAADDRPVRHRAPRRRRRLTVVRSYHRRAPLRETRATKKGGPEAALSVPRLQVRAIRRSP